MTLVLAIIGGFILIFIFSSISDYLKERSRLADIEKTRQLEERLRIQEEAREVIPCRICEMFPNRKLHDCYVTLEINSEMVSGKKRYRDTLVHRQGRLRKCDKTHPSEVEALKCGNLALRKSQIGEAKIFMSSVQTPSKAEVQTPRTSVTGLDADSWADLVLQFEFKCAYCGAPGDASTFHREHKIPLARGGDNILSNIVPACAACNLDKKILTDEEYRTLRRERADFLNANPDENFPGNALRPKVESLPKDNSVISAPRVSVKVGTFYASWIDGINRLASQPTALVIEASNSVTDDTKIKKQLSTFYVRRDKDQHWLTNGERAIFKTFHPNPRPRPRSRRASLAYERLAFMCGISQRELDALNIALERGKDLWIWGDKDQPIGLIKVEKIFWRYDKSEDTLFHLYRIPRGEQINIKIKKAHKKTSE